MPCIRSAANPVYRPLTLRCSYVGCGRWFRNHSGRTKHLNSCHRPPSPEAPDSTSSSSEEDEPINYLNVEPDLNDADVDHDVDKVIGEEFAPEESHEDLHGDEGMPVPVDVSATGLGHGTEEDNPIQHADFTLDLDVDTSATLLHNKRIYHDVLTGELNLIFCYFYDYFSDPVRLFRKLLTRR